MRRWEITLWSMPFKPKKEKSKQQKPSTSSAALKLKVSILTARQAAVEKPGWHGFRAETYHQGRKLMECEAEERKAGGWFCYDVRWKEQEANILQCVWEWLETTNWNKLQASLSNGSFHVCPCCVSYRSCFFKPPNDTLHPPLCSLLKYKSFASPARPVQGVLLLWLSEKSTPEPVISPYSLCGPHYFCLLSANCNAEWSFDRKEWHQKDWSRLPMGDGTVGWCVFLLLIFWYFPKMCIINIEYFLK